MAIYRLTEAASEDVVGILRTSRAQFGSAAQKRYRSLLIVAFKAIASDPQGPVMRDRSEISEGLHSFHLRHAREAAGSERVTAPSHLIFYRSDHAGTIVILRVLHERMDPAAHLS